MDVAVVQRSQAQLKAAPRLYRQQYIRATAEATRSRSDASDDTVEVSLEDLVIMLEIFSMSALLSEIQHDLGIEADEVSADQANECLARLRAMAHIDLEAFFATGAALFGRMTANVTADDDGPLPWDQELRTLSAILEEFPTKAIAENARAAGRPDLTHRAQTSHDALRAVLRRNDPAEKAKLKVAGNAYAMGRLSLGEVAVMLEMSESDTVFELERAGYVRSIETIVRCADETADADLARIAAGVAARGGKAPPVDPGHVRRDVVASQRIENIDARRTI